MGTVESEHYQIKCRCGASGTAHWQENDGARFLRRGPETMVEITGDFDWTEPVPVRFERLSRFTAPDLHAFRDHAHGIDDLRDQ